MSISSRITEMEQHISNAYDGLEDLGIDLTNVDKNIDNIASMLEEVWDEYPKVTATDVEEASLNGTKKGRMEIDLKGQTSQEQLTGKNLAYISSFWKSSDSTLTIDLLSQELTVNGSASNAGNFIVYLNDGGIILKANKTYILSVIMDGNVSGNSYRVIYASGGVTVGNITSDTTRTHTYTPTEDTNITLLNFDLSAGTTFSNFKIKVQVEEGSTATSYEPYCRTEYQAPHQTFHNKLKM